MHEIPYLHDVVILFGAALAILAICNRFRIPAIIGFLFTGILTGPSLLGLIKDTHHIQVIAELGVVFLLFIIGLELYIERLKKLLRPMLLGGGLQAALTIIIVSSIAMWQSMSLKTGLFWGMIITLSSTAIVLKLYQERNELESPHGRNILGILLFQDFLIVPFILIIPILSGSMESTGLQIALRFGGGILLIAVIMVIGRFLLPHLLHIIVVSRVRELLVLGALFICLGAALVTEAIGFSLALGAFLAGILISETDYHFQIETEITPFRDVFNSIFFISIGMLIDMQFVISHWLIVLVLTLVIISLKAVIIFLVTIVLSIPLRSKILTAAGLFQVGEFSFILVSTGYFYKLVPFIHYQLAMSVIVLTMLLTPLIISIVPMLLRSGNSPNTQQRVKGTLSGHIVICGYGLTGQQLTRVLKSAGLPYIVSEMNGQTVKRYKKQGINIIYGDSTKRTILEKCGVDQASCLVIAISDPYALRQTIKLARSINPDLHIIVRSNRLDELQELTKFGATEVIAQEFESSIEIVTHVLERLHVPQNIIRLEAKLLRQDGYQMLRQPVSMPGISDQVMNLLSEGTTTTFMLLKDHTASGKEIKQLDLRQQTGVTILAVMRGEQPYRNPSPEFTLQPGDVLVLTGNHVQIDQAFLYLEKGVRET